MSHVPTVLKSDRSVFDEMLPVDDNAKIQTKNIFGVVALCSFDYNTCPELLSPTLKYVELRFFMDKYTCLQRNAMLMNNNSICCVFGVIIGPC